MALKLRLYKFDKRPNSTKKPAGTDTYKEVEFTMKASCSVTNPILNLNLSGNDALGYNYMYIPDFDRYYFIDDIVYSGGIWSWDVYAHVDVLATWKADIKSSTQYLARSVGNANGNLIDNLYPTYTTYTNSSTASVRYDSNNVSARLIGSNTSSSVPYFGVNYSNGYFCVGITGNNGTGVTYYRMSYNVFRIFVNKLFTKNPSDMSDVSQGIANAIYDPISYVSSCRWYPDITLPSSGILSTYTINLGR